MTNQSNLHLPLSSSLLLEVKAHCDDGAQLFPSPAAKAFFAFQKEQAQAGFEAAQRTIAQALNRESLPSKLRSLLLLAHGDRRALRARTRIGTVKLTAVFSRKDVNVQVEGLADGAPCSFGFWLKPDGTVAVQNLHTSVGQALTMIEKLSAGIEAEKTARRPAPSSASNAAAPDGQARPI